MLGFYVSLCIFVIIGVVNCQNYIVKAPDVIRFKHEEIFNVSVSGLNKAVIKVWLQYDEKIFSEKVVVVNSENEQATTTLRVKASDILESNTAEEKPITLRIYYEYQGIKQSREVIIDYRSENVIAKTESLNVPTETGSLRPSARQEDAKNNMDSGLTALTNVDESHKDLKRNIDDTANYERKRRGADDSNENVCSPPWQLHNHSCVQFIKSKPFMSWQGARDLCKANNGDLLSISDYADQESLRPLLITHFKSTFLTDWWVGLKLASNGTWYWVNDEELTNSQFQSIRISGSGEENILKSRCGYIDFIGFLKGESCDQSKPFICEQVKTTDCTRNGILENGTFTEHNEPAYGMLRQYTCSEKHISNLPGLERLRFICDNGEWKSIHRRLKLFLSAVKCNVISCVKLSNPDNGNVTMEGLYVGDKAIFSCNEGFYWNGSEEWTCLRSGQWNHDNAVCNKKELGRTSCSYKNATDQVHGLTRTCADLFSTRSICFSNICTCSSGYVTNRERTSCAIGQLGVTTCDNDSYLVSDDGRTCAEVFSTGSSCESSVCKCSKGYITNSNRSACIQGQLGITTCAADSNLVTDDDRTCPEVFSTGSTCLSSICKCSRGYINNFDKSACILGQLGTTDCADDSNMVVDDARTCAEVFSPGSTCVSGICKCSKGYLMNSDKSACIKGKLGIVTCADETNLVTDESRTCAEVFSTGSSCLSSICKCSKGYIQNADKSTCIQGQLGIVACANDSNLVMDDERTCAEVFLNGSACVSSICKCTKGYIVNANKSACIQGQLGITTCAVDSDSYLVTDDDRTCEDVFSAGSICMSSICKCSKGYIKNADKLACLQGQLGITTCADDSNLVTDDDRTCVEVFSTGSTCVSSICKCSRGFIMNADKLACIQGKLGITTCVNDSHLVTDDTRTCEEVFSKGSTCMSSICKCSKGYIKNADKSACTKGQLGITSCADDSNLVTDDDRTCAEVFSTGSTCVSSICKCSNGYIRNSDKSTCIQRQLGNTTCVIGSNLVSDDDRTCAEVFSSGSTCVSSLCKCSEGYIKNADKSACIQGQLGVTTCVIGSTLVSDDDRTCAEVFSSGSNCISSLCKCSKGYIKNADKSACIQGQLGITTCVIGSNLVSDDDRTCAEVFSSGSTCVSSICKCSKGYIMNADKSACIQGQLGITSCADDSNLVSDDDRTCAEVFSPGSTCMSSICQCFKGYIKSADKLSCIQGQLGITTCVIGSNLVSDDDRTCAEVFSSGSTCVSSICKCSRGYIMNADKSACIQGRIGITSCADDSNLVSDDDRTCAEVFSPGSTCMSSTCQCFKGYIKSAVKLSCIQGQLGITTCVIGSNLVSDDDRTCAEVFSSGSTCMSSICECSKGYIMNADKSACIQGQLGITSCADDSNMVSDDDRTCAEVFSLGSTCVSSICQCSKGYIKSADKLSCIQGQLGITTCVIGSNLVSDDDRTCAEVFSSGSTCVSSICKCSKGYIMNADKSACIQGQLGLTACADGSNLVVDDARTCVEVFSPGSTCLSSICKCAKGYIKNADKSSCNQGKLGITTCTDKSNLVTDDERTCGDVFSTESICVSSICQCSKGYIKNADKSACIHGQLGKTACVDDSNLVTDDDRTCAEVFSTGSTCVSSLCKCLKGYIKNADKSACIHGKLGITTCANDSHLVTDDTRTCEEVFSRGSTCMSSVCKCSKGYIKNADKSACTKGQLGITACADDSNLVTDDDRTCAGVFSTGSTCVSNTCKCSKGYIKYADKSACSKGHLGITTCVIGSNLVSDDDRTCSNVFSTGSTCVSGICTCSEGYIKNADKSACIDGKLGITMCTDGSNLVSDDDRTCAEVFSTGSTCMSSICKCSKGYTTNSGRSTCIKGHLGKTTCAGGSNLVTNDDRTCAEIFSTGSTCVSGICKCSQEYLLNSEKSACIKGQLGITSCADGSNLVTDDSRTCAEMFSAGSTCVSGICKCSKGFITNSRKSACILKQLGVTRCADGSNLVINDNRTCAEVFATGSACVSGICKCSRGFIVKSTKSECAIGQLGITTCVNGSNLVTDDDRTCADVFTDSTCESNTCKCSKGYVTNSGKSACIKGQLGISSCAQGSNMVIHDTRTCAEVFSTGSSCISNRCECSTGYVMHPAKSACIEGRLGNTTCDIIRNLIIGDTRTCEQVFSTVVTCLSGVCTCSDGYATNVEKNACEKECPKDQDYVGTYWNKSSPGREIKISCPEGFSGNVSRFCDDNGVYQPPVYNCTRTELTSILTEVTNNTGFNASNILARLANATADNSKSNGTLLLGDVDAVNDVMIKITNVIDENSTQNLFNLADSFLDVANNILEENTTSTWIVKVSKTGEGVNTLLDNVDRFIAKIVDVANASNTTSTEFTKSKPNLYLKVGSTASCVNRVRFPDRNDTEIPEWAANTLDSVDVPCSTNDKARAYSSVFYRNISYSIPLKTSSTNNNVTMKLDAPVISFSFLPKDDSKKLDTPIQLTFQLFSKSMVDPVCSFWTKGNSSGGGYWSSDGCWLENYNKAEGTVVCMCDHLTNFAVLTSPSSIALGRHRSVLSIISMVGCIISMAALVITVIVHIIYWRKVNSERTILNVNLCCTLFVAYLVFLAGIERTVNKGMCTAVAVLLHFVYLAAFFIMLVEGIYLAHMVFKPLSKRKPGKPLLIAAYVIAAAIVAVSAGSVQLGGYGTSTYCWLSTETGLIWTFIGPVICIVCINIIIIAAVVWKMFGTTAMSKKTNKEKAKVGLRSVIVLMPLMGVTWLFGVFSINADTILFQYLFAILNSLQGFLIFIFHCCMNQKIREAFRTTRSRKWARFISFSSEAGPSKSQTKSTSNTDV